MHTNCLLISHSNVLKTICLGYASNFYDRKTNNTKHVLNSLYSTQSEHICIKLTSSNILVHHAPDTRNTQHSYKMFSNIISTNGMLHVS